MTTPFAVPPQYPFVTLTSERLDNAEIRDRTTPPEITGGGLQLRQYWCRADECKHTAEYDGGLCPVHSDKRGIRP